MKNLVILIGNTGDDIKMHHFENGGCIARFPLATSSSYTNKQTGEKVTNTEWHQCVARNKGAELLEKYVSKGDRLYIRGNITYRKWTDSNGVEKYSTEINVDDFTFLTTKNQNQQNTTNSQPPVQPQQNVGSNEEPDDPPF